MTEQTKEVSPTNVNELECKTNNLSLNWNDIDHGFFKIKDKLVPEEVMEKCLSFVDLDSILLVAQVCRLWKHITTRSFFWHLVCQRNGINYDVIPSHIKGKPCAWIAFWSVCRHKYLDQNLIKNHSGFPGNENPILGWQWRPEETETIPVKAELFPTACLPLPENDFFENNTNCFVMAIRPKASIFTIIDLRECGLNASVLKLLTPFTMDFNVLVSFGAVFGNLSYKSIDLQISMMDDTNTLLFKTNEFIFIGRGSGWTSLPISIYFSEETDGGLIDRTCKIQFEISGKAYDGLQDQLHGDPTNLDCFEGPQFSRCCIKINLIHNPKQYKRNVHTEVYNGVVLREDLFERLRRRFGEDE